MRIIIALATLLEATPTYLTLPCCSNFSALIHITSELLAEYSSVYKCYEFKNTAVNTRLAAVDRNSHLYARLSDINMSSRSPSPESSRRDDHQGRLSSSGRESPPREDRAEQQQNEPGVGSDVTSTSAHYSPSSQQHSRTKEGSSHHHKSHSRYRKHSDSSSSHHSRRHSGASRRSHSQSRSPPPDVPSSGRRHHEHASIRSRSRSRSPQDQSGSSRRSRSRSRSDSPPEHGSRRTHSRRSRSKSPLASASSSQKRREHGSRRSHSRSRSRSPLSRHNRRDHSRWSRSRSRSPPPPPPSSGYGKRFHKPYHHRGGWQRGGGYRGRGGGYHKARDRTSTPVVSSTPVLAPGSKESLQSQTPLFAPPLVHREPDPNAGKLTPEEKLERALAAAQAVRNKMPQLLVSTLSATPSTVPVSSNPLLKAPVVPQKKKLVWNKKSSSNPWEGVSLGEESEGNSETQAKFRRLMGMGKGESAMPSSSSAAQPTQSPVSGQSEMKEKHEKLLKDLEQQYEASRYMTHLARGSGLGFGFSSNASSS